jgi:hypothetical protein
MKDPRRMLQGDADGVERALLRSAASDEPPLGSEHAVLCALAILPTASSVASSGIATGAGAGLGSATGTVASTTARLGAWSLVRWVGIGVVAGTATLGGVRVLSGPSSHGSDNASTPLSPVGSALHPASRFPGPTPAAATNDAESAEPAPSAKRVDKAPWAPADSLASAPVGADPSLAAEVAALDRARKALEADDPTSALRVIEEQQRSHGEGVLRPETEVVRIEALIKAGHRQAGVELGRRFLAKYPDHPLQVRVRSLINQASSEGNSKREGAGP